MLAMHPTLHRDMAPSAHSARLLPAASNASGRAIIPSPATAGNWLVYVLGDHARAAEIDRALGHGFDQVRMADCGPLMTGVLASQPDLVILADEQPSLDLVCALRASRGGRNLPIILLGASSRSDDVAAAFSAGVSDYVCAQFCPSQLRARALSLVLREACIRS